MIKALVNKKVLLNPLAKAQTVVDKKTTMNLLNNVFIGTEDRKLVIEATDLEISYQGIFEAEIQEQGEITVNARRLYEIVRELPTDEIYLEQLPENWLRINIGEKGEYKLGGVPADGFPRFTQIEQSFSMEIDPISLRNILKKTVIAVSTDESKYALTGLLLETDMEKNALRAVASDSHRLNLKSFTPKDFVIDTEFSAIIPRKGVLEIIRLLESASEDNISETVKITADEKILSVSYKTERLNIRQTEGTYPDYRLIIPETRNRYLYFNRVEALSAFKRVAIVDPDPEVKSVRVHFKANEALIESLSKESSDARERIPIEYSGEPFQTALNARYIVETLGVMESEKVRLTLNDDESPCILEGDEDPDFLALIMPMTLE